MDRLDLIDQAICQLKSLKIDELKESGLIPNNSLYYPTIYYPPVPMHGSCNENAILNELNYDQLKPCSVYIHIPFCRFKCLYCHWMVHVDSPQSEIDVYLNSLALEIALWKKKFGAAKISPRSVLIGGGTPTALSPKQTATLFRLLNSGLDFRQCTQITCEAEPGSLLGEPGLEKLRILKENGVSRISLGVQAFDDESLRYMGRQHSSREVMEAIEQVRKIGFNSLSVDLIYGYPGSTAEKWLSTLKTAMSLEVDSFQLYRLRIIPHGDRVGTIKNQFDSSPDIFPLPDDIYLMKMLGSLFADKGGFKETSCRLFSRNSDHISHYMVDHSDRLSDVIGFGASSWSNVQGRFYLNTGESLEKYATSVRNGILPINRGKTRTADDERRWAVAVTLKHNGVPKNKFRELTGISLNEAFPRQIEKLKKHGLVREQEDLLKLTGRGRFFADEVVMQFYHPRYLPFPRSSYPEGELNPFSYHPELPAA